MAAELSLFLLRLIHSRFGMPLKLSAGTLLILLSAHQKSAINPNQINPDTFKRVQESHVTRFIA